MREVRIAHRFMADAPPEPYLAFWLARLLADRGIQFDTMGSSLQKARPSMTPPWRMECDESTMEIVVRQGNG